MVLSTTFLLFSLMAGMAGPASPAEEVKSPIVLIELHVDVADLLPQDDAVLGWKGEPQPRLFEGKALYQHIDGGAEIFHKNGFQKLAVQDYVRKNGAKKLEARVEVYDMGSVIGAANIFAENTHGVKTSAKFGEISTIDDMQIIFKRGRFYVTVTAFEVNEEVKTAMEALAGAVNRNICGSGIQQQ